MIDDVEHFDPELDIEILRDSPDVIVLEHGEVETGNSGTVHDIAASIAAQVEALQGYRIATETIGLPKSQAWSGGNRKALGFNVIFGIARVRKATAPGATQAIRVSVIVTAQCVGRIVASAPVWGKGDAVAERQNRSELPALGNPLRRT